MTTSAATSAPAGSTLVHRPGRWIDGWDPENPEQWEHEGRRIARRNLIVSIAAEFLGFTMLGVWGIVVPQLADAGFAYTTDQQFWLIALPGLTGAAMRVVYTFMVPLFGGRNWTVISSLLLVIPAGGLAWAVSDPETPFGVMLAVAALAGLGGGNFASSMVNISFFYPQREKGRALGFNAAGGNLGTAGVQFLVPIIIVTTAGVALERAGLVFVPLAILAALAAFRWMDNLTSTGSDLRSYALAVRNRHTWILSVLYIGTFGSFIGFANTFPTLAATQFPDMGAGLVFLGALTGALTRPFGGALADRFGGTVVTIGSFVTMALGVVGLVLTLDHGSFVLFLGLFLVLFGASGIGNGSTYRMIPAVFQLGCEDDDSAARGRRAAAGCIGIAGAIGALGGFFVPRIFAEAGIEGGFWIFVGVYAVLTVVAWGVYGRRSTVLGRSRI